MYFFALATPTQITYPRNCSLNELEKISEQNSVLSSFLNGEFIESAAIQTDAVKSLIENKLLQIGTSESPIGSIVECLKKCIFGLAEDRELPLVIRKNGTNEWNLPRQPFLVTDLPIEPIEDAAIICLELYRNNIIELVGIL